MGAEYHIYWEAPKGALYIFRAILFNNLFKVLLLLFLDFIVLDLERLEYLPPVVGRPGGGPGGEPGAACALFAAGAADAADAAAAAAARAADAAAARAADAAAFFGIIYIY